MAALVPSEFDISNVKYSAVRTLDNGGKVIYLSYNGAPLVLQTPEMHAPFGISKWDNEKGGNKVTVDLSFKGKDTRPVLENFFQNFLALDEKLVTDGADNSVTWLKKKYNETVVKEFYTPIVKYAKDKNTGEPSDKYPPTFKVTLPKKDGKYTFEVYNQDKQQVNLDDVELKGARVTALIQCLGIWVAGQKYGLSWKVLQMKVVPQSKINGYSFKELKDDKVADDDMSDDGSDDHPDAEEVMQNALVESAKSDDELVESSDGEDDLEVKPVEPVKKPAVVKKVAVKK